MATYQTVEIGAQPQAIAGEISPAFFLEANFPVTLKFEDIVYKVKTKKGAPLKKTEKSKEKVVLKGITGVVRPGEMLAMMGPSGGGKTTLLTAMGGRLGGHLTGTITYNGKPFSNVMKRNIGFVTQDDVLYPHLTVTETLVYTAFLRLSRALSKEEKTQCAKAVITQLGLSRCKDNIIGGQYVRGVSGGERKRVSIGQEMLINPSLLFLDEPTTGLDSTTAQTIVSTLWELANGGRTIVMTIHQPSSRLFYMFHKILLLSGGNTLYFGKGSSAMDYFSTIGFVPSVAMNPADFLLDLANGVSTGETEEDQESTKQTLMSCYKTHLLESVKSELTIHNHHNLSQEDKPLIIRWSNTWWEQFSVLIRRGIRERKHEIFSTLKIVQVLVSSILSGFIWFHSDVNHLQDQVGIFFYCSGFWGYISIFQAIFTFPQERKMLEKERASGMYRLSSYFMALTLGDLPMDMVLPTIFFTIIYWMAGLKATAESFLLGLLVILFDVVCSQGLGLAIGAAIMDQKSATTVGSVVLLSFTITSGYYVQNIPKALSWIKYLSINQHAYKLLLATQYEHGETYLCGSGKTCLVEDFPAIKNVGIDGIAISLIAMTVMVVGYRFVAYVALMRIGVPRK